MYDIHRDLAELDARMKKTAAFAATLLGENFDEAAHRAREHGYQLRRIVPDPRHPESADLQPNRIRCRMDDQDTIIETQVG